MEKNIGSSDKGRITRGEYRMNKRILVYFYEGMADFEFSGAAVILGWLLDFRIDSFAFRNGPVKALTGLMYHPSLDWEGIKETGVDAFDGIIIPGGTINEFPEALLELVRAFDKQDKLVAAICAGPEYLGKAGILEGRRFTASFTQEEMEKLIQAGIFPKTGWTSEKVVRDKNVITADGFSFIDFGVEIGDFFNGYKSAEEKESLRNGLKGF